MKAVTANTPTSPTVHFTRVGAKAVFANAPTVPSPRQPASAPDGSVVGKRAPAVGPVTIGQTDRHAHGAFTRRDSADRRHSPPQQSAAAVPPPPTVDRLDRHR